MKTRDELRQALEALVDESSVADLLDELSCVCFVKAEHVRANWQDSALARSWEGAGSAVERIAERLSHSAPGIGATP